MTNPTNSTRPMGDFETRANARLRSPEYTNEFESQAERLHKAARAALLSCAHLPLTSTFGKSYTKFLAKAEKEASEAIKQTEASLQDEATALADKVAQMVKKQANDVAAGAKAICQKKGAKALHSKLAAIFTKKAKAKAFEALKTDPYEMYKKDSLTLGEITELIFALEDNPSPALLKAIKGRNYLNARVGGRTTIMHMVAEWGSVKAMKHLAEAGANVDAKDLGGYSPMTIAAHNSQETSVRVLLKLGADKTGAPEHAKTPAIKRMLKG